MAKKPRTAYVKHSSYVEGGKGFEKVEVYKPSKSTKPYDTFDRVTSEAYLNDYDAAVANVGRLVGVLAPSRMESQKPSITFRK